MFTRLPLVFLEYLFCFQRKLAQRSWGETLRLGQAHDAGGRIAGQIVSQINMQ